MDEQFSYEGLYRLLEERRAKRPEGSYTTADTQRKSFI